jgi:hypothetical protein
MKNIDIFQSDVLLKINSQPTKFFIAIDFLHEIEHKSQKNKVQLINDVLEVLINKKVKSKHWETLEITDVSK